VDTGLSLFLIVPDGAFDATRRELEARLKGLPPEIAAILQLAENTEDAWARSFDVSKRPALYLVDARREFVWSAVGEVGPDELAKALKRHLVPVPKAAFRPLSPRVSVGGRAPDVAFVDDSASDGALHRLAGRTVHLCFWQDWSAPSRAELRRLQALLDSGKEASPPVILAFHGGSTRENFDRVRKELGLTFPIVQDTEHRVARLYGVRCWPTTIVLSDGVIEEVRQGIERPYGR
jgi:peroxiredoxin